MAIGSHGTGRGGTVGDDRTGRSAELGKALSFSSLFVTPTVESDQGSTEPTRDPSIRDLCVYGPVGATIYHESH